MKLCEEANYNNYINLALNEQIRHTTTNKQLSGRRMDRHAEWNVITCSSLAVLLLVEFIVIH